MYEEEYNDLYVEGVNDHVEIEADTLTFVPSERKNLLGRTAYWRAELNDWQAKALASIADENGEGLRVEWGVFMCPARLLNYGRTLEVNTSGTW